MRLKAKQLRIVHMVEVIGEGRRSEIRRKAKLARQKRRRRAAVKVRAQHARKMIKGSVWGKMIGGAHDPT